MDLTFVIPFEFILSALKELPLPISHWREASGVSGESGPLGNAQKSLVLVEVENSWASGILIHQSCINCTLQCIICAYVLTNAHLLRPYLPPVRLRTSKLVVRVRVDECTATSIEWKWYEAEVTYISDYQSHFDVALLRICSEDVGNLSPILPAELTERQIQLGYPIYVLGYAIFKPNHCTCRC